jgi:hypothetical protein
VAKSEAKTKEVDGGVEEEVVVVLMVNWKVRMESCCVSSYFLPLCFFSRGAPCG